MQIPRVGLIKIGQCCLFTWRDEYDASAARVVRTIEISAEHCLRCIETVKRLSPSVRLADQRSPITREVPSLEDAPPAQGQLRRPRQRKA